MTRTQPAPGSVPHARYQAHRAELEAAMAEVFAHGQFILGPQTHGFERDFAAFLGVRQCVGVASGTDALELALRAAGLGPGDAVATVSFAPSATAAAIDRAGAVPLLVEVDPITLTMDPNALDRAIADHRNRGNRPRLKAIIPVHLHGSPADMPSILDIATTHGLCVIEDCAQAAGASIEGRKLGAWGTLAAFSFYPTKNLGCFGDGGAVVTDDDALGDRVRLMREYGWSPRPISLVPGVNSRLDELHAAMLRVLLPHLPQENQRRETLARRYNAAVAGLNLQRPSSLPSVVPVYHQYVVRLAQRDRLRRFLNQHGIATQVHYPAGIHQQPAYAARALQPPAGLPVTEEAARTVLSLPMSPHFEEPEIQHVLAALDKWGTMRGAFP